MNELFNVIVLGIVQGITEFVPISSSGHLVLLHELLNSHMAHALAFDVALHLGTLVAVLIYFRDDVVKYLGGFFSSIVKREIRTLDQRMAWYLLVGTIPGVVVGALFNDYVETVLRSPLVVAASLFTVGISFIITERYAKRHKEVRQMTSRSALLIGVGQAIALIPGVSRSGMTMITGMQQGFTREAAARFSFLLSAPIILGAGAKSALDIWSDGGFGDEVGLIVVGFAVSAMVGYIVIALFLRFIRKNSLDVFAYYSILLAIIVIIYFL